MFRATVTFKDRHGDNKSLRTESFKKYNEMDSFLNDTFPDFYPKTPSYQGRITLIEEWVKNIGWVIYDPTE